LLTVRITNLKCSSVVDMLRFLLKIVESFIFLVIYAKANEV